MKVIGVGFQKTGTTTLARCLQAFGLRHRGWDLALFQQWTGGDTEGLLGVLDAHDSVEDFPWPFLYRDVERRFPDARFILTVRADENTWFDSVCRWVERRPQPRIQRAVYGHSGPEGHKDDYIDVYRAHNQAVRDHFAGRDDRFLEVCWEQGDGWEALAAFLQLPAPDRPFPHANPGRGKWRRRG